MNISLASCHLSSFTSTKSHHFSSEKSIPWVGDKGLHSRGGSELLAEWVADRHGGLGGWTYDVCLLDALEFSMTDCFMDCGGGGEFQQSNNWKKYFLRWFMIFEEPINFNQPTTNHQVGGVYISSCFLPAFPPLFEAKANDVTLLHLDSLELAQLQRRLEHLGGWRLDQWSLLVGLVAVFSGTPGTRSLPECSGGVVWYIYYVLLWYPMITMIYYDLPLKFKVKDTQFVL